MKIRNKSGEKLSSPKLGTVQAQLKANNKIKPLKLRDNIAHGLSDELIEYS